MKTKRILSALLSLCLTLSLVLPATAAGSAVSLDEALQAVTALGIMSGDGAMSQRVTRAQFITMGPDRIDFCTLPGEWKSPYIYVDPEETLALVNQFLNPYVEDRLPEDLNIPD